MSGQVLGDDAASTLAYHFVIVYFTDWPNHGVNNDRGGTVAFQIRYYPVFSVWRGYFTWRHHQMQQCSSSLTKSTCRGGECSAFCIDKRTIGCDWQRGEDWCTDESFLRSERVQTRWKGRRKHKRNNKFTPFLVRGEKVLLYVSCLISFWLVIVSSAVVSSKALSHLTQK